MTTRRRSEDGALAAEFVGVLPLVLIVAMIGWQLLLVVGAGTSAATAARNGSRALSNDEDTRVVVERSLPGWLREGHRVDVDPATQGGRVDVHVRVPVLFPGITTDAFQLTRSADLPVSR